MLTDDPRPANKTASHATIDDAIRVMQRSAMDAATSINIKILERNWLIEKIIAEEELIEGNNEEHLETFLMTLSNELSKCGGAVSINYLYMCSTYYKTFPEVLSTAWRELLLTITWSHYLILMRIDNETERMWYLNETAAHAWDASTLQHNVDSQQYYRRLDNSESTKTDKQVQSFESKYMSLAGNRMISESLGLYIPREPIVDLRKILMDVFSDSLISSDGGYSLAFKNKVSDFKGKTYVSDLVFFNYNLDCFIIVDFLGYKPDKSDQDCMIESIDAFNRKNRPKGKDQTLGILIGYDGGNFHITPAMKFNKTNIEIFYRSYQKHIQDFAIPTEALLEHLTPDEIRSCMRRMYD